MKGSIVVPSRHPTWFLSNPIGSSASSRPLFKSPYCAAHIPRCCGVVVQAVPTQRISHNSSGMKLLTDIIVALILNVFVALPAFVYERRTFLPGRYVGAE